MCVVASFKMRSLFSLPICQIMKLSCCLGLIEIAFKYQASVQGFRQVCPLPTGWGQVTNAILSAPRNVGGKVFQTNSFKVGPWNSVHREHVANYHRESWVGPKTDPVRGNQILLVSKKAQHPACLTGISKYSRVWLILSRNAGEGPRRRLT